MEKFGFSEEISRTWQDEEIFLQGEKDFCVILAHGWSAFPRQMTSMAKKINQAGYALYLPILQGHGTKPEDLEKATAQDWENDVIGAVERMRREGFGKIVVGGVSMGGNAAMLASLRTKVDGIVLIGSPVHLKNHLWVWLGTFIVPFFHKYIKKKYPSKVKIEDLLTTSYQYYPVSSVRECMKLIRKSVLSLNRIKAPILILQTNMDYLVAKYSPWVIYNSVRSKFKKMQWIKTKHNSHVIGSDEEEDSIYLILKFLRQVEDGDV